MMVQGLVDQLLGGNDPITHRSKVQILPPQPTVPLFSQPLTRVGQRATGRPFVRVLSVFVMVSVCVIAVTDCSPRGAAARRVRGWARRRCRPPSSPGRRG